MTKSMNNLTKSTKEELRDMLTKRGVAISNTEFRKTKKADLIEMVNNANKDSNNEGEVIDMNNNNNKSVEVINGGIEMNNNNSNQMVSVGDSVERLKAIVNNVNAHTSNVGKAVAESNKAITIQAVEYIESKMNRMEAKIDALLNNKPVYNKASYRGNAQRKVASANTTSKNRTPQNTLVKSCSYCKAERTYASIDDMKARVSKAKEMGLKPFMCEKCAKEKFMELQKAKSATPQAPVQDTPVKPNPEVDTKASSKDKVEPQASQAPVDTEQTTMFTPEENKESVGTESNIGF